MLDESLQAEAALYASGAMSQPEREHFELLLEFDGELRAFSAGLLEAAAALAAAHPADSAPKPDARLKTRILAAVADRSQPVADSFVMSDPEARVEWVSPAFTEMCGYPLEELRGKKLGPVLQGRLTDPSSAERLRHAIRSRQPIVETILNYHKDGRPYWVEIHMAPVFDEQGELRRFLAREREITDRPLPVG